MLKRISQQSNTSERDMASRLAGSMRECQRQKALETPRHANQLRFRVRIQIIRLWVTSDHGARSPQAAIHQSEGRTHTQRSLCPRRHRATHLLCARRGGRPPGIHMAGDDHGGHDAVGRGDAGVMRVRRGECIRTLASTVGHPRLLDELQQRFWEGPSLDAARENQTRRVDDLAEEPRWPTFSAESRSQYTHTLDAVGPVGHPAPERPDL